MGRMWMGTRGYERWVPDCSINPDFTRQGASATTTFQNGGRKVVRSRAGSKGYQMTWNMKHRDDVRFISDLAEGLYDAVDGVNLVYFLDPMAMDKNVLSQMYASPMQGAVDGMAWMMDVDPKLLPTSDPSQSYPARSAIYSIKTGDVSRKIYVPIPAGYTGWVGIHGDSDGRAAIHAARVTGQNSGPVAPLPTLRTDDLTRVGTGFSTTSGVTGIELTLSVLRNAAANPSLRLTSGTVNTPDGTRPRIAGLVGSGDKLVWQDTAHAGPSGFSMKIAWPRSSTLTPDPDNSNYYMTTGLTPDPDNPGYYLTNGMTADPANSGYYLP